MMISYNYYTLSFVYVVRRKDIDESWEEFFKVDCKNEAGLIASPAESDAAGYVEIFSEAFLTGAGIEFRHEYSWPDGSCYKIIRIDAEQDIKELVKLLDSRIANKTAYKLRIGGYTPVDPESTKFRGARSTQELFSETTSP